MTTSRRVAPSSAIEVQLIPKILRRVAVGGCGWWWLSNRDQLKVRQPL